MLRDTSPSSGPSLSRDESLEQAFSFIPLAVYTCDRDGLITMYNEHAAELWGRRPEPNATEERFCGSLRLWHTDGTPLPHDQTPMATAIREGSSVRDEEVVIERPDGSTITVSVNIDPFYDENGERVGAINVFGDITPRKRLEDALRDSERQLRRASAAKDEFLGMVSHELKNPLTTVLGIARHLEDQHARMDLETVSDSLSILSQDASRLAEIIDNMLTLSRAEIAPPELEPLIPSRVVERAVAEYAKRRHQRDFELRIEDRHSMVLGHSGWLEQVVLNLLSNAHKYSDVREPIEVTVRRSGGHIEIAVFDHGPGISDEESDRLFQAFVRGASANSGVYGLGLGLSVCQRLVKLMNGEITVHRREDASGTCALLRFPVLEE